MSIASRTAQARSGAAQESLRRWFGQSDRAPSRGLRALALLTALNTYAVIVMGGVVRTTGSGLGCDAPGDNGWPLCRGRLLPPAEQTAIIEFTHRWLAATMSVLLVALVAAVVLRYRHRRRLLTTVLVVAGLLFVQITLGQLTVQYRLPGSIVMVHLANAELLLAAVILTCLLVFGVAARPFTDDAASRRRRTAVLWMTAAAAGVYGLVLSGAFVVAQGAGYACDGWPLCGGGFALDSTQLGEYNVLHRVVAGIVGAVLAVAVMKVGAAHRDRAGVRVAGGAVALALCAQIAAGAILVETRLPTWTRSVHEALASALWAATILVALLIRPGVLGSETAAVDAPAVTAGSGGALVGAVRAPAP